MKNMLKWVEIDLKVMAANARAIRKAIKPGAAFMAVVKADGYGHGALRTARTALANGADCLGVLTAAEGAELRAALPKADIRLLAPSLPQEAAFIAAQRLRPTADSVDFIKAYDRALKKPAPYAIDIDSGLGRWGVRPADLPALLEAAAGLKRARPASLSTHLAYRPPHNMTEAEEKLAAFKRLADGAAKIFPGLKADAANSAILADFPRWQLDMSRVGNLLYGIYPTDIYRKKKQGPPLPGLGRPWQFYSRVIAVKTIKKGESLGYASEFVAPRDLRLATVPAGYSDGLTMEPSEPQIRFSAGFRYWGLINGKKAYFTGRTGISHTLLDVTGIPEARVGSPVALHVRRTAVNARIPRVYR
jgi:alanine racemase